MNNLENWLSEFKELNPATEIEEEKKSKTYKNDMFNEVLPALDRGDKSFYNTRTPEQKAELDKNMWMIMRWMSSTKANSEHHILMTNVLVNKDFSIFTKKIREGKEGHAELQWMLLAMCGVGRTQRHEFISPPRRPIENEFEEIIIQYYPLLNREELDLLLKVNTEEDFRQFFRENGYDDKSIDKLFKKGK
jgi:hypothetical protein